MDIRVKYKELNKVSNTNISNSELLDDKIELLRKKIIELQDNWKGEEADIFYNSILPYLDDLKSIPVFYNELSSVMNKMNNNYQNTDDEYEDSLKKGVILDENDNNRG